MYRARIVWRLATTVPPADRRIFQNLEQTFAVATPPLSRDDLSDISRLQLTDTYYLKRYHRDSLLRQSIGRGRFVSEYRNLKLFGKLGIPTPEIVLFGGQWRWGVLQRGVLATRAVENASALSEWAQNHWLYRRGRPWLRQLLADLADYTRRLHDQGFAHVDLKARNILLRDGERGKLFFIDCPSGHFPLWGMRRRGAIKDLACMDKVGKTALSARERLYFYKCYAGVKKLSAGDKRRIRRISRFFKGRE